jgi:hypothetical protein
MKSISLKSQVNEILRETLEQRKEYVRGYRDGQKNYHQHNLIEDWENSGHPEDYKTGYLQGVKDAKRGTFNSWITKFLSALGHGIGKYGNRNNDNIKWRS